MRSRQFWPGFSLECLIDRLVQIFLYLSPIHDVKVLKIYHACLPCSRSISLSRHICNSAETCLAPYEMQVAITGILSTAVSAIRQQPRTQDYIWLDVNTNSSQQKRVISILFSTNFLESFIAVAVEDSSISVNHFVYIYGSLKPRTYSTQLEFCSFLRLTANSNVALVEKFSRERRTSIDSGLNPAIVTSKTCTNKDDFTFRKICDL
jgi:hypothetical protein